MRKLVYTLYNAYLGAYDLPQYFSGEEADLKEGIRRSVLADPDGAFKYNANEKTLVILGYFDDNSGEFDLLTEKKKLVDLASMFPPGYLQKKEAC